MEKLDKTIRTRIAPSPTGDPHVGTLRTALFNYFVAKQGGGNFALRVEDTDKTREVPGSLEKIYESLEWIGVFPDEGMKYGGDFGPYLQSKRLDLYQRYANDLLEKGYAYYCFCTPQRLTNLREEQEKNHLPPRYDSHCLKLDKDEAASRAKNEQYVIRLKVPEDEVIKFNDAIKGEIEINSNEVDDQVLMKSDGYPTYHLAVVIDDHLMKISHVIRGEEWISSTPKHILLYRYFGWDLPVFAHLPLILNTDRSKLAKRHNNTSVLYYKVEQGYHPGAMCHFMMFMGWTPKEVKECYMLSDFAKDFSLDRVGASPAIFDIAKLNSLSHLYFVSEDIEKLTQDFIDWISDSRHKKSNVEKEFMKLKNETPQLCKAMLEVVRSRCNTLLEMSVGIEKFFNLIPKLVLDDLTLDTKINIANAIHSIEVINSAIAKMDVTRLPENSAARISWLTDYFRSKQPAHLSGRDYLHPTRVAITGERVSMNMFEYLSVFLLKKDGKKEIISRLSDAKKLLENN
jgi:glutamyl-tRNA synthetase